MNIFNDITGLKLKDIHISEDSEIIRLDFIITDEQYRAMADEYKAFIIDQLNEVYIGHQFEGQVIQYG